MTDARFFMGYVTRGSRLGVLLMFCLFFSQFQPSVAYKRVAYKKKRESVMSVPGQKMLKEKKRYIVQNHIGVFISPKM